MNTLNHDTELEEIIEGIRAGFNTSQGPADNRAVVERATAVINTYLYKQTLELIGKDVAINQYLAMCSPQEAQNRLRKWLRKAAAERWGQE